METKPGEKGPPFEKHGPPHGDHKPPHGKPPGPPGPPINLKPGEVLTIMESFKQISFLSVPIFSQQLLRFLQVVVNFTFVAFYDDSDMLGGLGLGMSFYVVFNMAFFIGLNVAITTFGAQLSGMGRIRESGMYLNGGRMLNIAMAIPMMIVLGCSYQILISWNQDSMIAYHASQFLIGNIPGLVFIALAVLHNYYLNSFHKLSPGMVASIGGLLVQICFTCLFMLYFDMGLFGAGLALSVSNIFQSAFFFGMLYCYEEIRPALIMPQFNREQWRYIKEFLSIGIPSMLMACLEIAGVELMQPLAGRISAVSSGAQAVVMNIYAGLFTLYLSISIATSIFVGGAIGANNAQQARIYTKCSVILVVGVTAAMILILALARDNIVGFYTSDDDIKAKAIAALGIFCIALVPDCVIYSQMGAFRGLGQQKAAAIISILSLIGVSLPLGCFLAYYCGFDINGFWMAYGVRSTIVAVVYYVLLWHKFDWEKIAKEAQEREEKVAGGPPMGGPPMDRPLREGEQLPSYGSINSSSQDATRDL